jgi:uncharacterized protein YcaQ
MTGPAPTAHPLTAARLRAPVVRGAFAVRGDLAATIATLGFVQADPIRAPARAQDLILRQRVPGYRVGQLERRYPSLGLDEDFVYAYGFVPPATRALLHPRRGDGEPTGLAREVLAHVRAHGATHPSALVDAFGDTREVNYWGGHSRATTRALEQLQYHGWLRVARRERGVRVYEAAEPVPDGAPSPEERWRRLVLLIAMLLGPLPETSLRGVLRLARWGVTDVEARGDAVADLLRTGALERGAVDGVRWAWATGAIPAERVEAPRTVRLLAPFDPLVWDRARVEQLWGWAYRFEAYTPAAKRQFGYYALPLLWADRLVGWANVAARDGTLDVAFGFVDGRPRDRAFARALDAELARTARFLDVRTDSTSPPDPR